MSRLPASKGRFAVMGSYVLLIKLPEEKTINIGKRQSVHFRRGYYAYVGSAMGGFKSRLDRHLRENKKPHWHIDYLLQEAVITGMVLCEAEHRLECTIAQALSHQFDSIPGFGSSDCHCRSHLFYYAPNEERMKSIIMTALKALGMKPRFSTLPQT